MEDVQKSLWSLHLAVVLLGVTALFSKIIPLSALDITFGRSVVACACLLLLLKISGKSLRLFSYKDLAIGVLLGVIMALPWVREASVQRRLPGTVHIRLAERRPGALQAMFDEPVGHLGIGHAARRHQGLCVPAGQRAVWITREGPA